MLIFAPQTVSLYLHVSERRLELTHFLDEFGRSIDHFSRLKSDKAIGYFPDILFHWQKFIVKSSVCSGKLNQLGMSTPSRSDLGYGTGLEGLLQFKYAMDPPKIDYGVT